MDVVFQQSVDEDADFVEHLQELGFQRIVLGQYHGRFSGKFALFEQAVRNALALFRRTRSQQKLGTVVAIGHFAFAVKLLARLHVFEYDRLFCSAFFIRSPRWFPFFRVLAKLDTPKDHYLVFSSSEVDLYSERLGIDRERLHYIPGGDWCKPDVADTGENDASDLPPGYYFSGGYSNRDYASLVEAFRRIDAPLLIVCSKLNKDVDEARLPANIRVLRDVPSSSFDRYIRHATAGIVPLRYDVGSSGQSVLLRMMRQGKPIVASDMNALRDYIEPGVSGYLIRDLALELPGVIARMEADPRSAERIGQAALAKYHTSFSRPALAARLQEILRKTAPGPVL